MAYYIDLFSPETYEAFGKSDRTISGFRPRQLKLARRVQPGDKLACYMTKLSRWCGMLEVVSGPFEDSSPIFYSEDDPFSVRFRVKPLVWLEKGKAFPIHDDEAWEGLSFTRHLPKSSIAWTAKVRGSLVTLTDEDGYFLEKLLLRQATGGRTFEVDEEEFRRLASHRVRRTDKDVTVSVPVETPTEGPDEQPAVAAAEARESHQIQALLADIGTRMGMKIWVPKSDRGPVLSEWKGDHPPILDRLPLNYDETTLKTIEQIDVIWLKGRAISRAFEVEHTTSIYSGLLRMADLLALQPNMDIQLHIVGPLARREKVFQEIQRPVFSLLDRAPLSEVCTFLSYDSVRTLAKQDLLAYLSDDVLEEYEEAASD